MAVIVIKIDRDTDDYAVWDTVVDGSSHAWADARPLARIRALPASG